ncbi:MAG: type 1 glutamine amidotransferase [Gammaproteobacteria bacterium]|nr:MAG: type 1 glutamine amidotransferase [Gammaproteobacteria bacterium]
MLRPARIVFVEMMGVPGSYDASVYDHFEDKDQEGLWFVKRYAHVQGITIETCNVCLGESLPAPDAVDGIVLAGSYNSVHDHTDWQQAVRAWLPVMRRRRIPILGICGSHQLLAHAEGASVVPVEGGPFAGTFPVQLTEAGRASPLMRDIADDDCFHYANSEHVDNVPAGSTLLASSSKVPVAVLDFGNHCYTTQFHPEATDETLGTIWRFKAPELMSRYHTRDRGDRLVENFLRLARDLSLGLPLE